MTDRERRQLRGPVRTCRIDHSWGDLGSTREVEFREDGACLWHRYRNSDGTEYSCSNEYDEHGRVRVARTVDSAGAVFESVNEYEGGRLARVVIGDRADVLYEYDSSGCKQAIRQLDPRVNAWSIEGFDAAYPADAASTMTT